ncbi:MAG: serine/threonine protein kinase [Deltaproteobacteria bacterium]|nr:serine/threonine protein kinase [Deltaproteobacteria bacterium]
MQPHPRDDSSGGFAVPEAPSAVRRIVRPPSGPTRRSTGVRPSSLQVAVRCDEREFAAVCMELGPHGGLMACGEPLEVGARAAMTARASESSLAEVCLVACVVDARHGGAPGGSLYGVDWLSATSSAGPKLLHAFLRQTLDLDVDHSAITSIGGFAVFRFWSADARLSPSGRRLSDRPRRLTSSDAIAKANLAATAAANAHPETTEPVTPRSAHAVAWHADWPADVPAELSYRYTDLRRLGAGGYGVVYEAWDDLLDRDVALKFMHPGLDGEGFRRQFLREVRLTVGLAHPHIVRIYDAGKLGETLYFAMESIAGRTLTEHLRPGGMELPFVARVVAQLASALDYVHSRGIVHYDVKPDNVLVERNGNVQLFDFGLARQKSEKRSERSVILGTPQYMAPEQPNAREPDGRTDQYSLAVVAYELLTGRLPFVHGNLFVAHALEPVPDPRALRLDLPPNCVPVLMRGLAKRMTERFDTCHLFARALATGLGMARSR